MKKAFVILFFAVFVLGMSKLSFAMMCGEHKNSQQTAQTHSEHEHNATEAVQQEVKQSEEAVNVGNKICPVSGEAAGEGGMKPVTYEYQGKIYNFCCADCVEEFKKDPEKYIKKVEEELQTKSEGQ